MPKLLDFIKEKGLSHEQVISILEQYGTELEIPDQEESEESETQTQEKPDQKDNAKDKETSNEETNEEKPELIQLSKTDLSKLIQEAVEEKFKARLKPPSKGRESNTASPDKNIVKKNWFEVMV